MEEWGLGAKGAKSYNEDAESSEDETESCFHEIRRCLEMRIIWALLRFMLELLRIVLELLRIIIILVLLGGLGSVILGSIYRIHEAAERYSWLGSIAILLLLFVFYRNKLQFSGWYKGKGREKLPKPVSFTLIWSSIFLIISPFILGWIS